MRSCCCETRSSHFHRGALGLALAVACISIPLQMFSGDFSARFGGPASTGQIGGDGSALPDTKRRALASWGSPEQ